MRQYYIRDHHPAIVERELYETVQRVLEQKQKNRRRQNKKSGHPFDRRVLCAACGRFYCGAVKSGTRIWYCPTAARNNGLRLCRAENIPEETLVFALCTAVFRDYGLDRTLLFAGPDGAIAGQGPSDVQTGEKLRTLFYSIQQRLEKILNDVYVERDRSRYKRQLATLEKAMEQDAAEQMRRNGELSTELENRCRTDKRQYEELAAKLDTLEEYWNELECDHVLRAEALQWVRALPRNRNGLQEFLHGITGRYFRAFVLDLTVCPQGTYKVRWFDDRSTEVNRKDRAEEENADG